MERRTQVGAGLVLVGLVMFGLVLAFPVEPVRVHDTTTSNNLNESLAEEYRFRVVAYENLSDRGQELYVKTLESGGTYRVPVGEGAPEFTYPTDEELRAPGSFTDEHNETSNFHVVIERPANDSHLPPADERYDEGDADSGFDRSRVTRYDLMTTRTKQPPVGSGAHLPRLAGLILGLSSLTAGGYLLVSTS